MTNIWSFKSKHEVHLLLYHLYPVHALQPLVFLFVETLLTHSPKHLFYQKKLNKDVVLPHHSQYKKSLLKWLINTSQQTNTYSKINNINTKERCGRCSKLTVKTQERRNWYRSVVFIADFEHISHIFLVLILLPFNR